MRGWGSWPQIDGGSSNPPQNMPCALSHHGNRRKSPMGFQKPGSGSMGRRMSRHGCPLVDRWEGGRTLLKSA